SSVERTSASVAPELRIFQASWDWGRPLKSPALRLPTVLQKRSPRCATALNRESLRKSKTPALTAEVSGAFPTPRTFISITSKGRLWLSLSISRVCAHLVDQPARPVPPNRLTCCPRWPLVRQERAPACASA